MLCSVSATTDILNVVPLSTRTTSNSYLHINIKQGFCHIWIYIYMSSAKAFHSQCNTETGKSMSFTAKIYSLSLALFKCYLCVCTENISRGRIFIWRWCWPAVSPPRSKVNDVYGKPRDHMSTTTSVARTEGLVTFDYPLNLTNVYKVFTFPLFPPMISSTATYLTRVILFQYWQS